MTRPLPGSGPATPADHHRCACGATGATTRMSLTWPVAGSGRSPHGPRNGVLRPPAAVVAATATGHHVNLAVVVALAVLAAV